MFVVVMFTKDKPQEVGDLINANEYLDAVGNSKIDYTRRLKVRRLLICRVCKLKFRTRRETQEHIRREHRRG
jgi:hypothetical protein